MWLGAFSNFPDVRKIGSHACLWYNRCAGKALFNVISNEEILFLS
nr:MAG TPA: DdrB-like protein [Caudoviricetes sp.]